MDGINKILKRLNKPLLKITILLLILCWVVVLGIYLYNTKLVNKFVENISPSDTSLKFLEFTSDNLTFNIGMLSLIVTLMTIGLAILAYWVQKKLERLDKLDEYIKKAREVLGINVKLIMTQFPDLTSSQQIPSNLLSTMKGIINAIINDKETLDYFRGTTFYPKISLLKAQFAYSSDPDKLIEDIEENIKVTKDFKPENDYSRDFFLHYCYWMGIFHRQVENYPESIGKFLDLNRKAKEHGNREFEKLSMMGIAITCMALVKCTQKEIDVLDRKPFSSDIGKKYKQSIELLAKYNDFWERSVRGASLTDFGHLLKCNIVEGRMKNYFRGLFSQEIMPDWQKLNCALLYRTYLFMKHLLDSEYVMIAMNLLKVCALLDEWKKKPSIDFSFIQANGWHECELYKKKCFRIVSTFPLNSNAPNIIANYYFNNAFANHIVGFEDQAEYFLSKTKDILVERDLENELRYIYSEDQERLIMTKDHLGKEIKELQQQIKKEKHEGTKILELWNDYYQEGKFIYGISASNFAESFISDQIVRNELNKKGDKRVLEVGCGYGRDLIFIANKYPDDKNREVRYSFYALDGSTNALEYMQKFILEEKLIENPTVYSRITLVPGQDITSYHVSPDDLFDVIYAHYFLHLFSTEKRKIVMNKLMSLLKDGGILKASILSINDRLFGIERNNKPGVPHSDQYEEIFPFTDRPWYLLALFSDTHIRQEYSAYGNLESLDELCEIENVEGSLRGTTYFSITLRKQTIQNA